MADQKKLRAAVIGLGRMGKHHVAACVDTDAINLIGVYDAQPNLASQVATETGCEALADIDNLTTQIDLAIIAVPTQFHTAIALPLLSSGISCLVEKPMAATEQGAQELIEAAAKGDSYIGIGHVERFNPAISALRASLESDLANGCRVTSFSARRLNLKASRTYDVDAVLDLMIHDLDLLIELDLGAVASIECAHNSTEDCVSASLNLDSGITASFDVSRIAASQNRSLTIETTGSTFDLKFTTRAVTRTFSGDATPLNVKEIDPLRAQLASFIAFIGGDNSRMATGEDGRAALQLANRVRDRAGLL
ncbi:MAG: Gfo/Idh/MocA family oxidoreductase [Rhodospirillaceae bacterium]|nr:Gfo/Idh/MocA family oxidoreductase [Rhodospirillaceae bacterium]